MRTFIGHTGHCGHFPKQMQGSDLGFKGGLKSRRGSHIRPVACSAQEMVTQAVRERLDRLGHERDDPDVTSLAIIHSKLGASFSFLRLRPVSLGSLSIRSPTSSRAKRNS